MNELQEVMEKLGTPTLKAIAAVFDIPQQRLYSVAKQPKAGEVYDAKVYNWDAIQRFISRRLDAEKGLGTYEDVIAAALLKDEEFKTQDGRRGANRGQSIKQTIEVDGKQVAARKYKNFEMDADTPVCLRHDANVYKIVMQTLTHTVLRPINEDGSFASETVKVISNTMLNMKGAGPSTVEDAAKKRWAGEYVDPDAKSDAGDATAEATEA
jgi:hypothetical protein